MGLLSVLVSPPGGKLTQAQFSELVQSNYWNNFELSYCGLHQDLFLLGELHSTPCQHSGGCGPRQMPSFSSEFICSAITHAILSRFPMYGEKPYSSLDLDRFLHCELRSFSRWPFHGCGSQRMSSSDGDFSGAASFGEG